FLRPRRQQPGIVQNVARGQFGRQAQLGLARDGGVSQSLSEVLARASGVARDWRVDTSAAQLVAEGNEAFHWSGSRRAGDEQQRRARPAHAESGSRRPARNSGASASQARSSESSSMQRKCPYGQRARPKNEHGAHS